MSTTDNLGPKLGSKYTPGPWHWESKIDKRSDGYIRGELMLPGAVAGVAIARVCGEGREARANARLLATAPELLEALKECVNVLQEFTNVIKWRCDLPATASLAKDPLMRAGAAIRKAQGEL